MRDTHTNGRGDSAAHVEIITANPFSAPEDGALMFFDGEPLGVFDRSSSLELILRERSGIEILRAPGWVSFLQACANHGASKFMSAQ